MTEARDLTKQAELFPEPGLAGVDHRFHIQDELLLCCIGNGGEEYGINQLHGFSRDKNTFGFSLLTFFTAKVFNLHRLPNCHDRTQVTRFDEAETLLPMLTDDRVESICAEFKALYDHTQAKLRSAGLSHVRIRREYRFDDDYAKSLYRLKESADLLGLDVLQFDMDMINSYGCEGAYDTGGVFLTEEVPIEDVLYCSSLVGNREGKIKTMEAGEWVVLNRSFNGVVSKPSSCIEIRRDFWKDDRPFTEKEAREFMDDYSPLILRGYPSRLDYSRGFKPPLPSWKCKLSAIWSIVKA